MPAETWSGRDSPVQIAQFRSDASYPQMVAGVAWIDTRHTFVQLYPGRLEPSVVLPRGPMEVPPDKRPVLLATFNSAFKLADSGGGVAMGGKAYSPLKDGLATLIGYTDGRIDIQRPWAGGPDITPSVRFARQNLPLIVSGGRPNPNLADGPAWGATLGNAVRVWRSAIGVDTNGALIYAAADNQTVASLAEILIRAGAVRAMESRHQLLLGHIHLIRAARRPRCEQPLASGSPAGPIVTSPLTIGTSSRSICGSSEQTPRVSG